ncbi:helix-turn-helix domain-containing protein [Bacillus massilinigeriensis]|uniref:helix-turn-helix domain-containing protein n=1 Tax=Bacillus mediterraneensis TaxID=1805474 RepID=UPI0008F8FDFF|nr:helix-turn-helix domain-containing protein [Bacillus mediterraneensis]
MGADKKYPFKIEEYYSPGLTSLKRVYTQHPKFNGNVRLIYELLFDYWNPNYGYAFPTLWQLSADSGLGEATVERCIKVLIQLDLIEKKRSSVAQNNVYFIKKPVATIEELIAKFPEVEEHYEKRRDYIKSREETSKARLKNKKPDAANVKAEEKVSIEIIAPPEDDCRELDLDGWL